MVSRLIIRPFSLIDRGMKLSKFCSSISFAGCGTLNFYQTGVAASLQEYGIDDTIRFAGASAGSGLSVLLAQGIDAKEIADVAINILRRHKHRNILSNPAILLEFADSFMEHFINDSTVDTIQNRVSLSITSLKPMENLLVNQFSDKEDLCRAIRASCHIPSPRIRSVSFRGRRCIDGGFSNNQPMLATDTLSVSPFFFDLKADIRPSKKIPPWWVVIVPSEQKAWDFFELGKRDALQYINLMVRNGNVPKPKKTRNISPMPLDFIRKRAQENRQHLDDETN